MDEEAGCFLQVFYYTLFLRRILPNSFIIFYFSILRPVATFASASPARHRILTTPVSVPRLYSSHNSLTAKNGDDSDFITQAMSHEALNGNIYYQHPLNLNKNL